MRIVLFILAIACALLQATPAFAEGAWCKGCEAADRAGGRTVKGKGKPDSSAVCMAVWISDPDDAVSVTFVRGSGAGDKVQTYPRGALKAFAGNRQYPMLCLSADDLHGAMQVAVIPNSKEGCTTLNRAAIEELLRSPNASLKHVICLKKPAECAVKEAELGAKRQ